MTKEMSSLQSGATDTSRLSAEIDELRRMANRGDALAIAGGQMCAWWGLVITLGGMLEAAVSADLLTRSIPIGPLVLAAGYGGILVLPRLAPKSRFLRTWRTQAVSTAWIFAGIGILCISVGAQLSKAASDAAVLACICVVFGIVLAVMATSSRKSALYLAAAGWMVVSLPMLMLTIDTLRLLIFAAAAAAFMLVPGLVVARSERQAQ